MAAKKRIEDLSSRLETYSKQKDNIVTKAIELSNLSGTDVALLMFSPDGQATTFSSEGRFEDILLRFVKDELRGGPISNEKAQYLIDRLEQLKKEAEMMEKIAKLEVLQDKLYNLNRRICEGHEKMRYYHPDVEKLSLDEAEVYQKFLETLLEHVEKSKEKLFLDEINKENEGMDEDIPATAMEDELSTSSKFAKSNEERNPQSPESHTKRFLE